VSAPGCVVGVVEVVVDVVLPIVVVLLATLARGCRVDRRLDGRVAPRNVDRGGHGGARACTTVKRPAHDRCRDQPVNTEPGGIHLSSSLGSATFEVAGRHLVGTSHMAKLRAEPRVPAYVPRRTENRLELIEPPTWPTRARARTATVHWLEVILNERRQHSAIDMLSPLTTSLASYSSLRYEG
jgi:hypothetical protein